MGNSQSEIPIQANKKAEEERPQSQPQATRPTAEVLPSRAKQTIIQHEAEAKPPKADGLLDDGLHAGVFSNDMKEASLTRPPFIRSQRSPTHQHLARNFQAIPFVLTSSYPSIL